MSADPTSSGDVLDETLGRLSKKAGVKATILLDRATGSILKMEGQVSSIQTSIGKTSAAIAAAQAAGAGPGASSGMVDSSTSTSGGGFLDEVGNGDGKSDAAPADDTKGARELAALVWNYVKSSGDLVQAIDSEDELKLLRLRTKKQELVIVPDSKYLLIVVHDTPPA